MYAQDAVGDLESKIREYTEKLNQLSQAKDTLANQLKIISSQIDLTILKISQTENQIRILEEEIASLTIKINDLDVKLNQISSLFIQQVVQSYKLGKRMPHLVTLLKGNFNGFFEHYRYSSLIQKNFQDTLLNMEFVRTNYNSQKEQKAKKQQDLEILQKQLSEQKTVLPSKKTANQTCWR